MHRIHTIHPYYPIFAIFAASLLFLRDKCFLHIQTCCSSQVPVLLSAPSGGHGWCPDSHTTGTQGRGITWQGGPPAPGIYGFHVSHIDLLGFECQVFPDGQGCSAMSTESTAHFGTFIASFYKVVANVHRKLSETAIFSVVYQRYSHVSRGSVVSQSGPTVHSVAVQGDRGSFTLELDELSVLNL